LTKITYDRNRVDDDAIERMLCHLRTLAEAISTNPERRIAELPILTEQERHQVLVDWNDTTTDYPRDKCIQQLFEEQVDRTPEAVAVVDGDRQLTYQDLNRRGNQVAHYLRSLGVKPDALVGIYMKRSWEMMVGLLGIIKAGAAYLPLDADYPQPRLSFMLADGQVSVVLTHDSMAAGLSHFGGRIVRLDSDWEMVAQAPDVNPIVLATAGNLAYVIYSAESRRSASLQYQLCPANTRGQDYPDVERVL
jgi:microcystin synthetase protein McyB